MSLVTYVSFQGFIDERMDRLIKCLERAGFHVQVLLIHPRSGWMTPPGSGIHVQIRQRWVSNPIVNELFLIPLLLLLKYLIELPRQKSRTRLLYVHNFPDSYALPFLVLARLLRIPAIYELRDPWRHFLYTETANSARMKLRFKLYLLFVSMIERTAMSLASGHVFATRSLQELYSVSSAKPTCLVLNYSDYAPTHEARARGESLRKKLGLEGRFVASYIGGGFQSYRGVDVLLDSMAILFKQRRNIRLLIVGGHGETLSLLRKRAENLGIAERCVITGWVPSQQLPYYYLASDVGVIPHRRTPATEIAVPNKLFDYLVLGKPVVISALRELSGFFEDETVGLKVKPDDPQELAAAILRLACTPELVKSMHEKALILGKRYSFSSVESEFLKFVFVQMASK